MLPSPEYRTVAQVALALGRPAQTIYAWERRGRIRAVCIRRTRRLRVSLTDAARLDRLAEDRSHRAA